ncbi:dUTP diphosphatase [Kineococcus siccus]|uniref:dUTP diphosphatase n=1 Tax=Kineococcus siccus TaxID=2696567 RepID=UPI003B837DD7
MAAALEVPVVLGTDAALPAYAHPGDAGADLTTRVDVVIGPGERATVPTGVSIALPEGCVAFVVPRSGLAARRGLTVLNSPGTVDAGYRGEVRVTLHNTDLSTPVELHVGDRIAQLVVQRVERVVFRPVEDLPGSARGTGGHGSTGGAGALAAGELPGAPTTPSTTPPGGPQ